MISLLCLLVSPLANAHLLKVFAWSDGHTIAGNAYFAGGLPASGANIRLQNPNGQDIATAHPNAEGEFSINVPAGEVVAKVIADTQEGHIAEWAIDVVEAETPSRTSSENITASQTSNMQFDQ